MLSDRAVRELQKLAEAIAEVIQTIQRDAKDREECGHWLEARILRQVAAYFTRCEFEKARELLPWIAPDERERRRIDSLLPEERNAILPSILIMLADQGVPKSTRRMLLGLKAQHHSHRPPSTRQWTAQAMERKASGRKWPEIEAALLGPRKDGEPRDGESIRSSAARLRRVLTSHGLSTKPKNRAKGPGVLHSRNLAELP